MSIPPLPFTMDCLPFLNWSERNNASESEKAIFRSLVATVKSQPVLDDSLEDKAVKFLESVNSNRRSSVDAFLNSLASFCDNSSFGQAITMAAMEMVSQLIWHCSPEVRLSLIRADLITQLIASLNPLFLSFAEAVDIHINVMNIITDCFYLTTPYGLEQLEIEDDDEQQAVRETVFQQVVTPSEKYIWHVCVNRFSIIDEKLSIYFLRILSHLLKISLYYHPTMSPSLDGRHSLLLLRRLSRTAPTARKWKLSMLTIGSGLIVFFCGRGCDAISEWIDIVDRRRHFGKATESKWLLMHTTHSLFPLPSKRDNRRQRRDPHNADTLIVDEEDHHQRLDLMESPKKWLCMPTLREGWMCPI
ncbi:hypothetical protein BLNAU_8003 [Blattamonas nauphoetae]|uniref:Uncharacterized protein n=1 Tax=Blattamonas nauphoetae TaxID=2049346 RepID=A0ABQ9XZJ6_9EUKA|nr:hypothetical protein BLNAU_8003 [Blattamonas nauphoetae]